MEIKNGDASFKLDPYEEVDPDNGKDTARSLGVKIKILYTSAPALRSDKIGFVQTMRAEVGGTPFLFDNEKPRATQAKTTWKDHIPFIGDAGRKPDDGWALDRLAGKESPIYGQNDDGSAGANTSFGKRTDTADTDAMLFDKVNLPRAKGETMKIEAVTFALDETHGTYLGGVSWGFQTDAKGTTTKTAPALASTGNPAGIQLAALKKWNEQADLKDASKRNAPGQKKVVVP